MSEKEVLAKFNLQRKPAPKKEKKVKVKMQVKIQAVIIDKRDSGYNRKELKSRLLQSKKTPQRSAPRKPVAKKAKQPLKIKIKGKIKTKKIRLGKRITEGAITELALQKEEESPNQDEEQIQISDKIIVPRIPKHEPKVLIRASSYYMNNRQFFINFINSLFEPYREQILHDIANVSCERKDKDFSLLIHQKIVRDYINHYSPYRGLLLYHGLGSGKTCSSIAIAEGLKTSKKIIIMTPASLRTNYIEELKKCGDKLYRFNQYWEFISVEEDSQLERSLSKILSLPRSFIKKQKGAWLVDVRKKSNYTELMPEQKQSLDSQINKMIQTKYMFINYNGLRKTHLNALTQNGAIKNPFSNAVIIIDEAHNFVSRIVNKINNKKSLSVTLYNKLKSAKQSRIIFLTGTPIINYPNELGIMFNMLRGNIKTYTFLLDIKTTKKIDQAFFIKLFQEKKLNTIDYVNYNVSTKKLSITRNPFGFITNYKSSLNEGITLDEQGNIDNKTMTREIKNNLKQHKISIKKITVENFSALPDTLDVFKSRFIADDGTIKNEDLFKKRILGLTSYFRSAHESLLPAYDPEENLFIEKIPMSLYQLGIYEEARKDERDQAKKQAKRKKMKRKIDELYKDVGSTYRIFSRLFCNFVFPTEMKRPLPQKNSNLDDAVESKITEDLLDNTSLQDKLENIDGRYTADDIDEIEKNKAEKIDASYERRIIAALKFLKKNAYSFLSKEALKTYSPKFLRILENLQNPEKKGMHLIYSQFRTLEGIGILKLILEENGFVEFKINRTAGKWEIQDTNNIGKPSFVLYTGTESAEQKEIIRNIFNNEWKKVPANIVEEIKKHSPDNYHGEIIKIFMITAAGAEGISLRNVRHVHITEPYWHPVRIEQIIGRARRICSHHKLPQDERNVSVYIYLMTFSAEFIKEDKLSIELKLHDVSKIDKKTPLTSDEALYEISKIKENINKQLLKAIKESAMDCMLYAKIGGKEQLNCFSVGAANKNIFLYPPSINDTESDKAAKLNLKKIKWTGREIKIPRGGKPMTYVYRKNEENPPENQHEIYDFESYKLGNPLLKGYLIIKSRGGKNVPSGVRWI